MARRSASTRPTHPIRPLSAADARIVERLRKICLALPEANERLSKLRARLDASDE